MRSFVKRAAVPVVIGIVLVFVVVALLRSAPRRSAPEPPDAAAAPVRMYGRVEPLGGPVYVAARVPRPVSAILVAEGDTVGSGQPLLVCENSLEAAQVAAAQARLAAAERTWAISRDSYERARGLSPRQGISEQDITQLRLRAELDSATVAAGRAELRLARAQLDQLTLRAPVAGVVYKLDVRLGQTLAAGDDSKIMLGAPGLQARLFVESYWRDRVRPGNRYRLRETESRRELGTGRVVSVSPALGGRTVRSEDVGERFDVEYAVVILELEGVTGLPPGLAVVAEEEQ